MQHASNTIGRAVAIAMGLAATTGALTLLCGDAFTTGKWTQTHMLLPLSVLLAIGLGWLWEHTLRRREWIYAAILLVPFSMAVGLTMYQSIGGQKEKAELKASNAQAHNQAIVDAKAAITRAEKEQKASADMLRQAQNALQAQCVDGKKSKAHCDGIRSTISVYTGAEKGHAQTVKELKAGLERLGGEQVARPKAQALGEVAAVLGYDRAKVEAIANTLEPLSFPLLFELVAILAFGYGFRPSRHRKPERIELTPEPGPAVTQETEKAPIRRVAVHSFVAAYTARHGNAPQIPDVQRMHVERFGTTLPKSTAARWRSEALEMVQPVRRLRIVGG